MQCLRGWLLQGVCRQRRVPAVPVRNVCVGDWLDGLRIVRDALQHQQHGHRVRDRLLVRARVFRSGRHRMHRVCAGDVQGVRRQLGVCVVRCGQLLGGHGRDQSQHVPALPGGPIQRQLGGCVDVHCMRVRLGLGNARSNNAVQQLHVRPVRQRHGPDCVPLVRLGSQHNAHGQHLAVCVRVPRGSQWRRHRGVHDSRNNRAVSRLVPCVLPGRRVPSMPRPGAVFNDDRFVQQLVCDGARTQWVAARCGHGVRRLQLPAASIPGVFRVPLGR